MPKHPLQDVIIVVPGILGSVLERHGKEVWAPTAGALARALATLGGSVKELSLGVDDVELDDLGDGVVATRLVDDVHMIPGLANIDGYSALRNFIFEHFDVTSGRNYFELPYDWRRDNRVAARKLKALARQALDTAHQTHPSAKLILLAHSMGGLVSRYYLECLGGHRDVRSLITFGTPFRGSLKALNFIANGFPKKLGPLKLPELSAMLRSMTSVYQLLPRYACIHDGAELIRPTDAHRIAALDIGRARAAFTDFHQAIDTAVANRPQRGYTMSPVVGIGQATWQSAHLLDDGELVLQYTRTRENGDTQEEYGDSTVPRVSATPIELGEKAHCLYTWERHGGLQNAAGVHQQLLGLLTTPPDLDSVRDIRNGVALELEELYGADETITVQATAHQPNLQLIATVTCLASGQAAAPLPLTASGWQHAAVLPPLPPGDYRLQVAGAGSSAELIEPVSGIFTLMTDSGT